MMDKNFKRQAYTGVSDKNFNAIFVGDTVSLFGMTGTVCFECGAYGIGSPKTIDWGRLEKEILPVTGCDNNPVFCYNDNFISFWELLWNYNCDDDVCCVVEKIKKED